MRRIAAFLVVLGLGNVTRAQEPATPGPEHKILASQEGAWDTTMKMNGMEFKGTVTYKMELGGLWLVGSMESDFGGLKFSGKSLDTYNAGKKKYVSVWCDSMSTNPMMMEGTYDAEKKTMTMTGDHPGMDGKPAKWRSVSEMPDNNTINMSMYVGDAKEPMFTMTYKRK
jgi:hypothetical protein